MPDPTLTSESSTRTLFNMEDAEARIHSRVEEAKKRTEDLIEKAKKKSEDILQSALDQKAEIQEQAKKEGYEAGYAEGLKEGSTRGEQEIIESKSASISEESERLSEFLKSLPEILTHERQCLIDETQRDLLGLVLDIASLAVSHEVKEPNDTVRSTVQELAEAIIQGRRLIVEIHPDQQQSLETLVPQIKKQFSDLETVSLVTRDDFEPCQVLVRNEMSQLSKSPQDTLERLKEDWKL